MPSSLTARAACAVSGPLMPWQVVQPNATTLKPSRSSGSSSPARSRYLGTVRLPGARLVLTHAGTVSPSSTARLAIRPAVTIDPGWEVLVQLVRAAISTEPSAIRRSPGPALRAASAAA